jgi:hypothetical protein
MPSNAGSKISLTLDCWTSPHIKAFLGITAHYIDANWVPQSLLLALVPLYGEHTAVNLCDTFVTACDDFGILDHILGITTDNAANIDSFLSCLEQSCRIRDIAFDKQQQHVRCAAHIVNLAVQALLRKLGSEAAAETQASPDDEATTQDVQFSCIAKLRSLVVKIRSSPQRRGDFQGACVARDVSGKELILDTRTRWNSTHAMIKRACELRVPLSNVAAARSDLPELSDEEWELLDVVARVLSVFAEPVQPLCGDSYPTLNEAVPIYNYLFDTLEDFLDPDSDKVCDPDNAAIVNSCSPTNRRILDDAIQAAHDKIHGYYAQTWADTYAIAVILDPRLKMVYYKRCNWERHLVVHAECALQRAIEVYGAAPPQSDVADSSDRVKKWPFKKIKLCPPEPENELDKYLAAGVVSEDEDVLQWWKRHADEYPRLARIARDYLAIPATSVPSERAFSSGANLISDKRCSLDEKTIQACLCLKSWLN